MSIYLIWPAVFQVLPSRVRLRLKSSARTRTTGRVTSATCRRSRESTPSTWRVTRRTSSTAPSWLTSSLTTTPVTQTRSVRYKSKTKTSSLYAEISDLNILTGRRVRIEVEVRLKASVITHTGSVVVGPGLRAGAWEDRLPGQPACWVHCQRKGCWERTSEDHGSGKMQKSSNAQSIQTHTPSETNKGFSCRASLYLVVWYKWVTYYWLVCAECNLKDSFT